MTARVYLMADRGEGNGPTSRWTWPADRFNREQAEYAARLYPSWFLVEAESAEAARAIIRESQVTTGYECGICGAYHPIRWDGDCRDDANRIADPDTFADLVDMDEIDAWRTFRTGRILAQGGQS